MNNDVQDTEVIELPKKSRFNINPKVVAGAIAVAAVSVTVMAMRKIKNGSDEDSDFAPLTTDN